MDNHAVPNHRSIVGQAVAWAASALVLGLVLGLPARRGVNDVSRWCTVWALLERGTYAIDDCPWVNDTMDKVYRLGPIWDADESGRLKMHYYSSKPTLLPTVIAALLFPLRKLSGVPLDGQIATGFDDGLGAEEIYFKIALILIHVAPFYFFLRRYCRLADRLATGDWAWSLSILSAAFGTQLITFSTTLNNHTVAAFAAFSAVVTTAKIWGTSTSSRGSFISAGFFSGLAACYELPALALVAILTALLIVRSPKITLAAFVPAACLPLALAAATQVAALGEFAPAYADRDSYRYAGSYWNQPTGLDAKQESKHVYLVHATIGHHGIFSLAPALVVAVIGMARGVVDVQRPLAVVTRATFVLSLVVCEFYLFFTANYGGASQAFRWLVWLFPLWLLSLPEGFDLLERSCWGRRLGVVLAFASVASVASGLGSPWSDPWAMNLLRHLGLYAL